MRLYLVTTRAQADAIRRTGFPEYGKYFALTDDGEIVGVPRPRLSDLSWHQVSDFAPGEAPDDWEEIAIDFPEGAITGYEMIDEEGGNRVWYIPPAIAERFFRSS